MVPALLAALAACGASPDLAVQVRAAVRAVQPQLERTGLSDQQRQALIDDLPTLLDGILGANFEPYRRLLMERGARPVYGIEFLAWRASIYRDDPSPVRARGPDGRDGDAEAQLARMWATPHLRRAEVVSIEGEQALASDDPGVVTEEFAAFHWMFHGQFAPPEADGSTQSEGPTVWVQLPVRFRVVEESMGPQFNVLFPADVASEGLRAVVRVVFSFDLERGAWFPRFAEVQGPFNPVTGPAPPLLML